MRARSIGLVTAWMAWLCLSAAAWAAEVPLVVEEPIGAARGHEVVSGGIPLPEGAYKDAAAFSLFDGAKEVPVQVSPIVTYPDGSLHWALVSFPVTAPANSKKTYLLKDSPGKAAPANPVVVTEKGDIVEVSNGLVGFAVNRAAFNGFEWIKVGGKKVFTSASAANVAGGKGGPAKPIAFAFAYRGPVRTTLVVKGTYGDLTFPTYAMAITLNAGESAVHVTHTIRNGTKGAKKTSVADPTLCLASAGPLTTGDGGVAKGKAPAYGWKAFTGPAEGLVFMRHGGPRNRGRCDIEADGGQLVIHLSPGDGPLALEQGQHQLTELDFIFGKGASVQAASEPLHARAPCSWYATHDGMGVGRGFGSLEDETAAYRAMNLKGAGNARKMPNEKPNPTMYCNSFNAHWTSECDHLQGLTLGYIRTGQRGFLDQAHAWGRYWRTYLGWRSDEFVYGKEGRFRVPKWGTMRCCGGEGCHFYGVGIFNYALLTGEPDALEAAFDWAELANVAWYGQYAGKKPGDNISAYGSRGFSRCYLAVARAYDVARDKPWLDAIVHYVGMATRAPGRDPRGFTLGYSMSSARAAMGMAKKQSPHLIELMKQEKVEIVGKNCKHPKYGTWMPKNCGTWPEAMESMANHVAWEALAGSDDPAAQRAADDALDYCIAEAHLGLKYAFHPVQKAVYYYMVIDFPLPDIVVNWNGGKWKTYQPRGSDSWYTKWWPNTLAYGYQLTGDRRFRDTALECLWWGLSREYVNPPRVARDEAPLYARVLKNTKGDFMTPTAFAIGLGARPKADEQPPAPVRDLKAEALGGGTVRLTWTRPADAARYQVKFSTKPIKDYLDVNYREEFRTVTYWNMATNVVGEPAPGADGAKESMTLTVPAGKTLHFAVRSFDAALNRSAMSNLAQVEVK